MSFKFEVLQIVVVARHVEIDLVLAEERVPVSHKHRMVAVRSVRINRMVCQYGKKGCSPWFLQLFLKPRQLFGLLLRL